VFNRNPKEDPPHDLDETITNLISEFAGLDAGSAEQTAAAVSLKVLMELRAADKLAAKKPVMSPDMIAAIAANLLGIGLILGFEKANVITTKSLSLLPKIRF
jgi:hypothetical protein